MSGQSGKTSFVRKLLSFKHLLIKNAPTHTIVVKTQDSDVYSQMLSDGLIHEILDGENLDYQNLTRILKMHKKTG